MCRQRFQFTQQELHDEYIGWMEHVKTNIPAPFPGIGDVIQQQKQEGGLLCVVSHSSIQNITRDYEVHFGVQPDAIYGWDLPEHQRKPNPYPLLDIMKRYDLTAKDMLVVDDMKLAWHMVQPVGVEIAFAAWGKTEFPELTEEMQSLCNYTFTTPENLQKFLFG